MKSSKKQAFFGFGDEPAPKIVPQYRLPIPPDNVFYIYGNIEDELDYVDIIHAIRYAEPGQTNVLHINSPGGSLNVCLGIINAISASEGEVVTILDGEACSAAAMIWLAGHKKLLGSEHTYLMLHQAGWAARAKTAEHEREVVIMKKVVDGLINQLAANLLTDDEMTDLRKGIDVYLHGSEIIERVNSEHTKDSKKSPGIQTVTISED